MRGLMSCVVAVVLGGCGDVAEPAATNAHSGPASAQAAAGQLTAGAWDDNQNYAFFLKYAATIEADRPPLFDANERAAARDAALATPASYPQLDVALVVDTTGSMGDEIAYLQAEFQAIAADLAQILPAVQPRWALVLYRDKGAAYVVRTFDFTPDVAKFHGHLAAQAATGGGDLTEAVADGLEATAALAWRQGPVARVVFWVGDAAAHAGDAARVQAAVRTLAAKAVRVYPVAASGVDPQAEYEMRSTAQVTLGRYLFLTDDAGVGAPQADPTIPCYFVTTLRKALVRMLRIESSGQYLAPAAADVLRTSGEPTAGQCKAADGQVVLAF